MAKCALKERSSSVPLLRALTALAYHHAARSTDFVAGSETIASVTLLRSCGSWPGRGRYRRPTCTPKMQEARARAGLEVQLKRSSSPASLNVAEANGMPATGFLRLGLFQLPAVNNPTFLRLRQVLMDL